MSDTTLESPIVVELNPDIIELEYSLNRAGIAAQHVAMELGAAVDRARVLLIERRKVDEPSSSNGPSGVLTGEEVLALVLAEYDRLYPRAVERPMIEARTQTLLSMFAKLGLGVVRTQGD
jgi:hypothetical protein